MASRASKLGDGLDGTSYELHLPQETVAAPSDCNTLPQTASAGNIDTLDEAGRHALDSVLMNFVPVTSAPNAREYQRLVRSQAMKNYHAKRRQAAARATAAWYARHSRPQVLSGTALDTWTHDPFARFPFELAASDREFLHHVYTDPRPKIADYRQTYLTADWMHSVRWAASFHQFFAMVAAGMRIMDDTPETAKAYYQKQELQHTTKTLRIIRTLMSGESRLTDDSIIFAMLNLLISAQINQDGNAAFLHLNAMENMIGLRGGINALPIEMQFVVFWMDVNIGTTWDTKPRFPPPTQCLLMSPSFDGSLSYGCQEISSLLEKNFPKLNLWRKIFEDVYRLSTYIETEVFRKQSPTDLNLLNRYSIGCHLLLDNRPTIDFDCPPDIITEAMRLGMLLFIIPVWAFARVGFFQSSAPTSRGTVEQLRKLRFLLLQSSEINWGPFRDLRTWVIAMGFLEARLDDDVVWWTATWKDELRTLRDQSPNPVPPPSHFLPQEGHSPAGDGVSLGKAGKASNTSDASTTCIPKSVTSIMWIDAIHGERYRSLVGGSSLE